MNLIIPITASPIWISWFHLGKKKGELHSLILLSPREGLTWRYRALSPNVERESEAIGTLLKNQAEGFPSPLISFWYHLMILTQNIFKKKKTRKSLHAKISSLVHFSFQDNFHLSVWPICWDLKRGRFKASLSLKHCRFHAVGFHLLTCRLRRLRSVLPTWQSLGWVV